MKMNSGPDDFVADLTVYKGDDSRRRRDHYTEAEAAIPFRVSFGFRALQAIVSAHLRRTLPHIHFELDVTVKLRATSTSKQADYVVLNDDNFAGQISCWYDRQMVDPKNARVPLFVYVFSKPSPPVHSVIAHTINERPEIALAMLESLSEQPQSLPATPEVESVAGALGKRARSPTAEDNGDGVRFDEPCCRHDWRSITVRFRNSNDLQVEVYVPSLKRILSIPK